MGNDNSKDEECKDGDEEIKIKGKTKTCQFLNQLPTNLKFCSWKNVKAVCVKSCGLCDDDDDFDNEGDEKTDDLTMNNSAENVEEAISDSPSAFPSVSPSAVPSDIPSTAPSASIVSPIDSESETSS